MSTVLAILSALLAFCGAWIVVMNSVSVIFSLRNQRRGIDRHYSAVPFAGQILLLLAGLASAFIPRWILWSVALADLSLWTIAGYLVCLPFRRGPKKPPSSPS